MNVYLYGKENNFVMKLPVELIQEYFTSGILTDVQEHHCMFSSFVCMVFQYQTMTWHEKKINTEKLIQQYCKLQKEKNFEKDVSSLT